MVACLIDGMGKWGIRSSGEEVMVACLIDSMGKWTLMERNINCI